MSNLPEDRWVMVQGGRMRYQVSGSGPALVLVHGLLGYSFMWRNATHAFSPFRTTYSIDMLGAGLSDFPAGLDCSLSGNASRLIEFMDAVGVASCDLLATSYGGAVSMKAAALAPGRVNRFVLAAPVNPWSLDHRWLIRLLRSPGLASILVKAAPHLRFAHKFILRRLFNETSRMAPATLEGYSAPFLKPGALTYTTRILRTWSEDLCNLEAIFPEIVKIPTLLVWGDRDRAVNPSSASVLKQKFHSCRLVMFPGVGHLPYEEVPEEFHRAVREFLQGSNSRGSRPL